MDASTTTKPARAGYGQPALIGGLVMGVLSALPIVNAANACCCLWVVCGGLVAAYVLQQNQTLPITVSDGALVGLLTGVVGTVVASILAIPIGILIEPMQRAMVERTLEMSGNMPPALREILQSYGEPRTDAGMLGRLVIRVVGFVFLLFVGSIFSTLGGMLGAALFKKKPSPLAPEA